MARGYERYGERAKWRFPWYSFVVTEYVTIGKLQPSQWNRYQKLRRQAVRQMPRAFGVTYAEELAARSSEIRHEVKAAWAGNNRWLVVATAKHEPNLIGMVSAFVKSDRYFRHIATIEWMYVDPQFRGRGVGKALLSHLLDAIEKDKRIKKVRLMVNAAQREAIALYNRAGFRRVGRQRKEIFDGKRYHDELIMERLLR
jgi:ribosomal protein S18 acetylase RimI-like enzyme